MVPARMSRTNLARRAAVLLACTCAASASASAAAAVSKNETAAQRIHRYLEAAVKEATHYHNVSFSVALRAADARVFATDGHNKRSASGGETKMTAKASCVAKLEQGTTMTSPPPPRHLPATLPARPQPARRLRLCEAPGPHCFPGYHRVPGPRSLLVAPRALQSPSCRRCRPSSLKSRASTRRHRPSRLARAPAPAPRAKDSTLIAAQCHAVMLAGAD